MSTPALTDLLPPSALADAPHERRDLCDLLGWMMQLGGTVRVAGLLSGSPPPSRRDPGDAPVESLASAWDWRIDSIERTALSPLYRPFEGEGAVVGAAAAHDWLAEHKAFRRGRPRALLRSAALAISGRLHRLVHQRLIVVRTGITELRRQVGARVRELGAAPVYLERLDQTLREATETRTQELFARIAPELARRFEDLLGAELDALPESPSVDDVQMWYGADGWILDHVSTCRVSVRAACGHEARALKGFIAAIAEITGAEEAHCP